MAANTHPTTSNTSTVDSSTINLVNSNGKFDLDLGDLKPIEKLVKVGTQVYIAREASEGAAVAYRNQAMKAARFGPDGKLSTVDGVADVEPLLVSMCLFQTVYNQATDTYSIQTGPRGIAVSVPLEIVKGWPARVVKPLFDMIKTISNLDEEEDTEESLQKKIDELQERKAKLVEEAQKKETNSKNSLTDTTDTSH